MSWTPSNGSGACPPITLNDLQNCSGRGWCQDAVTCVCAEGWTGRGDLAFGAPTCSININAVRGLYGIQGCAAVVTALISILYTRKLLSTLHDHRGKLTSSLVLSVNGFICSTSLAMQGFYRMAIPEAAIGQDTLTTITEAVALLAYTACIGTFYYSLVSLAYFQAGMRKNGEESKLSILLFLRFLRALYILVMTFGSASLIALLFAQTESQSNAFATASIVIVGFICSALPLTYVNILSRVRAFIRARVETIDIKESLAKSLSLMDQLIASAVLSSFSIATISFIFAGWRDLQIHAATYFMPSFFIIGLILLGWGLWSLLASLSATIKERAQKQETRKVAEVVSASPARIHDTTLTTAQSISVGIRLE